MTRAEKAARIGELVLEILELAAEPEDGDATATTERPQVVVDDVARQRANAALRRLGLLPLRGKR